MPATDLVPPEPLEPLYNKPEAKPTGEPTTATEETAEPLGPIVITDPPGTTTTAEPPQTAGKWPTEPPTDSPLSQLDAENET